MCKPLYEQFEELPDMDDPFTAELLHNTFSDDEYLEDTPLEDALTEVTEKEVIDNGKSD